MSTAILQFMEQSESGFEGFVERLTEYWNVSRILPVKMG